MMTFLHVALANLAVATLLAVLAVLAGRFSRRPALVHSLWLLVLLKMITPPLVPLRIIPWPEQPLWWVLEFALGFFGGTAPC